MIPTAEWPSARERARQFLWYAQNRFTEVTQANLRAVPVPKSKRWAGGGFKTTSFTVDADRYDVGEAYWQHGLTGTHQRHEALFTVGYYLCCKGYTDYVERAAMLKEWIREKHNGYSKDWLCDPRQVDNEIDRLVRSGLERDLSHSAPGGKFRKRNQHQSARVRESIHNAVAALKQSGNLYKKNGRLNRAAVARAAKINKTTAKRYQAMIETEASSQSAIADFDGVLVG